MLYSKGLYGWCQKKKNWSLWLSRYFCHWGGLANVYCRCTIHTREVGGGPKEQRKIVCLNFSCLALKYDFFHQLLGMFDIVMLCITLIIKWSVLPLQYWIYANDYSLILRSLSFFFFSSRLLFPPLSREKLAEKCHTSGGKKKTSSLYE